MFENVFYKFGLPDPLKTPPLRFLQTLTIERLHQRATESVCLTGGGVGGGGAGR